MDDLELRVELAVLRALGQTLRAADFKVTAVVVDDVLVDVEPGDTTERLYGIAFDLGTTTVVATLLDLATGTPVAVALHAQPPAAVRRRRDHAHLAPRCWTPRRSDRLQGLAHATLDELAQEVCEAAAASTPPRSTRSRWPATRR